MSIERVLHKDKLLALIVREDVRSEGVNFFTSKENPLQLGVLIHKKGSVIKPHIHKKINVTIADLQEVLHIDYGKVEAYFYDVEGKEIRKALLNEGDTILLISGGHGFKILEDSKIIEIKQGPYRGKEEDKTFF
jgi:cupin fold WbuC family metalloprotein